MGLSALKINQKQNTDSGYKHFYTHLNLTFHPVLFLIKLRWPNKKSIYNLKIKPVIVTRRFLLLPGNRARTPEERKFNQHLSIFEWFWISTIRRLFGTSDDITNEF